MKVLYLTNYPAPYRVSFFNQLAQIIDLEVCYEAMGTAEREESWLAPGAIEHRRHVHNKPNGAFLRLVTDARFDLVVIGCYNDAHGAVAIMALKACRKPFIVNVDGEYFGSGGLRKGLRDFIVKGAAGYLIAGERTGSLLKAMVGCDKVFPYHFSSLTEAELAEHADNRWIGGGPLLCVGQYADYKGIDVLVDAMAGLSGESLTIVGAGAKASKLETYIAAKGVGGIRVVPFLDKQELGEVYRTCKAFVLPSRQECWGLVINEAASFGAPIVSTIGSGAALEFLGERHRQYLAASGSASSLADAIVKLLSAPEDETGRYSDYLIDASSRYSIERTVGEHAAAFHAMVYGTSTVERDG